MEKYALHTHIFTNWHVGTRSLERQPRTPAYVLDGMKKAGIDGIAITQFGEAKEKMAFEQLANQAKDKANLGKYNLVKKLENALVFADHDKTYAIIKGQEICTSEGHVLMIGAREGVVLPSWMGLDIITKDKRYERAVTGPAHPFVFGGIGLENLKEYVDADSFDFFEGKNSCFENPLLKPVIGVNLSVEKLDDITSELGINWIATSDCHRREDLGNGYIGIAGLDFANKDSVVDSLREVLTKGKFIPVAGALPLSSIVRHGFLWTYDSRIRAKLGWTVVEE